MQKDFGGGSRCKVSTPHSVDHHGQPLDGPEGISFLIPVLEEILKMDLQFVLLGDGEPRIANALKKIGESRFNKFYFKQGYDNRLAHLIEAGSDLYLMPSLYEPCGLNQIYSLRYVTLPIVRIVGELKVPSRITGIQNPAEMVLCFKNRQKIS